MTTHELANILLQQEDVPVYFQYFDGGIDMHNERLVRGVHKYNDEVYLTEDSYLFTPDKDCEDCEDCEVFPTMETLFETLTPQTRDAFLVFIDNCDTRDMFLHHRLEQPWLERALWSYYRSNIRLTKEHMKEISRSARKLGFNLDPKFIEAIERSNIDVFRYSTYSRQLASLQ